jgi:predicted CXXCH cytochrome family protein
LPPAKRDSVCAQCHLTGDVRVMRAGSDWNSFQPGGVLADYQTNFVRTQKSGAMTVTGHVENLQLSACKRASGEKLWCGSCHDPHVVPAPAETAATFRTRCLNCHTSKPCTEKAVVRAQTKDNCIGCHMPKSTASDAQHVVLTDHSIPRRPRGNTAASKTTADAELAPFDGAKSTPRDLALAYAYAAVGKTAGADRARATSLLERVVKQSPNDTEVLVSLAEIYRNEDKNAMARPLYRRAIQLDPGQATALAGLGAILMESGQYTEAVRLWKEALTKNAGLELVRLNLSLALLKIGDRAAAISNLRQALTINPAFAPARDLLSQLNSAR